jgi:hypothetical protein
MNGSTVVTVAGKPKLPDRVRHAVGVRHLARSTGTAYVYWSLRFIFYHNKRHPLDVGDAAAENPPEASPGKALGDSCTAAG